jgi:adenine-specific DNA methylase
LGILTNSTAFDGSIGGGHVVLRHGYEKWSDLFNKRQLLCLSELLKSIDNIKDQNAREYLLTAFSDSLMFNNTFTIYNLQGHKVEGIFKQNSYKPQKEFVENNIWGTKYGRGTFSKSWDKVTKAVEWANNPTERYVEDGDTKKTPPFGRKIDPEYNLTCGDVRDLEYEHEFDVVLTDPPYYNNLIYSETSNYFYVWLRQLLADDYSIFEPEQTPRAESIVANPAEGKTEETFEKELKEAFSTISTALDSDGVLVFTYHHSDSESWGELLEALCDVGFRVTATYPITADTNRASYKLTEGESVSFDIIIVARPSEQTDSVSWNSLRRRIYRTAKETRRRLERSKRELSRGDIGVIEMGRCFHEYSKHHGKVRRGDDIMTAKEVVQEIYGIIQEASDIGVEDVFIDLLDTPNPSFDDVNKLCRGTNATPDELKEMRLYNQDDGFELGTWDNEKRQAYIQERVNGDGGDHLSNLDKLQFLRYRYEKGQAVQNYVEKWDVDDDLRELAGRLADVTGDDTYTRVLGDRDITSY